MLQSAIRAELTAHIGDDSVDPVEKHVTNSLNESTSNKVHSEVAEVRGLVPAEREHLLYRFDFREPDLLRNNDVLDGEVESTVPGE
ncbi:hypothetical protein [Leucobacter japonicus]|uniref:hypothetical protein n=1 Tax=Leucobacter japonicus TaxID=1461259 RepID=UPI0006A7CE9A|nr:hypothetical protein [Leucobacter japonicus]